MDAIIHVPEHVGLLVIKGVAEVANILVRQHAKEIVEQDVWVVAKVIVIRLVQVRQEGTINFSKFEIEYETINR